MSRTCSTEPTVRPSGARLTSWNRAKKCETRDELLKTECSNNPASVFARHTRLISSIQTSHRKRVQIFQKKKKKLSAKSLQQWPLSPYKWTNWTSRRHVSHQSHRLTARRRSVLQNVGHFAVASRGLYFPLSKTAKRFLNVSDKRGTLQSGSTACRPPSHPDS
jgi:hypothetical protein